MGHFVTSIKHIDFGIPEGIVGKFVNCLSIVNCVLDKKVQNQIHYALDCCSKFASVRILIKTPISTLLLP